ncbi:MAG: HAD-IIA family hydrolase [Gemmataceae bacterium]
MPGQRNFLLDMDGVLVRGSTAIAGAQEFLAKLEESGTNYLIITNNPIYTPRDLSHRLNAMGLTVPEHRLFTCAMATAQFLAQQRPDGTAFVVGETGLTQALHDIGYVMTATNPDYVVLGDTTFYNFDQITQAVRLVKAGARFIATNPDPSGPVESGIVPACGAMAALIQTATGVKPYFVGKPNPLMMRRALNHIGAHSENTTMVGDRMDTDIIAGLEAGMETILVLSGVTRQEDIDRFPYRPTYVLPSVASIQLEGTSGV